MLMLMLDVDVSSAFALFAVFDKTGVVRQSGSSLLPKNA
jgi:hypothetical protein